MNEMPGVMIYFEVLDSIEFLDYESRGLFFTAFLKYAKYGEKPDFGENDALKMLWALVRKRIDASIEQYRKTSLRSSWGVYKRDAEKRGEPVLPYEEWKNLKMGA